MGKGGTAFQFVYICTFLVLIGFWLVDVNVAVLGLLLPATVVLYYQFPALRLPIIGAAVVGSVSDLLLNVTSREMSKTYRDGRWEAMVYYFDTTGTATAAAFGGLLTVWMVVGTLLLPVAMTLPQLLVAGFAVGALWGVVCQDSKAFENLHPFYMRTSGYIENRAWDGITISYALALLQIAQIL